jgi:hypothetical protein
MALRAMLLNPSNSARSADNLAPAHFWPTAVQKWPTGSHIENCDWSAIYRLGRLSTDGESSCEDAVPMTKGHGTTTRRSHRLRPSRDAVARSDRAERELVTRVVQCPGLLPWATSRATTVEPAAVWGGEVAPRSRRILEPPVSRRTPNAPPKDQRSAAASANSCKLQLIKDLLVPARGLEPRTPGL